MFNVSPQTFMIHTVEVIYCIDVILDKRYVTIDFGSSFIVYIEQLSF